MNNVSTLDSNAGQWTASRNDELLNGQLNHNWAWLPPSKPLLPPALTTLRERAPAKMGRGTGAEGWQLELASQSEQNIAALGMTLGSPVS